MSEWLCGAELLAGVKTQHYPNLKLNHGGLLRENKATLWSEKCLEVIQGVAQTDKQVDEKTESLRNITYFQDTLGLEGGTKHRALGRKECKCPLHIVSVPCI